MGIGRERNISLFGGVDKWALLLYFALVSIGMAAVISASWEEGSASIFSFSHNYVKQGVFLGISLFVGLFIMLLDRSIWHKISYPLYGLAILALLATLALGRTVNGAKAWFEFGPIRLQTMEFAKIAIALATARLMSEYGFKISSFKSLVKVGALLLVPLAITYLQNDTGSGLVLCSFVLRPQRYRLAPLAYVHARYHNRLWQASGIQRMPLYH